MGRYHIRSQKLGLQVWRWCINNYCNDDDDNIITFTIFEKIRLKSWHIISFTIFEKIVKLLSWRRAVFMLTAWCCKCVVLLYSAGVWHQWRTAPGGKTSLHTGLWHVSPPRCSLFLAAGSLCRRRFSQCWQTAACSYRTTQRSACTTTCLHCSHCSASTDRLRQSQVGRYFSSLLLQLWSISQLIDD